MTLTPDRGHRKIGQECVSRVAESSYKQHVFIISLQNKIYILDIKATHMTLTPKRGRKNKVTGK